MLLAHESGATWDEYLMVVVPLALFAFLLWRAKVRAEREEAERRTHETSDPGE